MMVVGSGGLWGWWRAVKPGSAREMRQVQSWRARGLLFQLLWINMAASGTWNVTEEPPPEGITASHGSWWPLQGDRLLDPKCSDGSAALRWRIVVTESTACEDAPAGCSLPTISFGGAAGDRVQSSGTDGVEFELAEPGPPDTVHISPGSSAAAQHSWPLKFDVEYHDGQEDARWRRYSTVTVWAPPTSGDGLNITLEGDATRCYAEVKRPLHVAANNRDASCDNGTGEWVEWENSRICCPHGGLWCRKAVATVRTDLATEPRDRGVDGPWASHLEVKARQFSIAGVVYRMWENIEGSTVNQMLADPDFLETPSIEEIRTGYFEAPSNICSSCGHELSGYFMAPATGDYTFMIASDDGGVLYLGASDTDVATEYIARVDGSVGRRAFNTQAQQTSEPQHLVGGNFYPLRALSNEDGGNQHVSVAVVLPDGTYLAPIPIAYYVFAG